MSDRHSGNPTTIDSEPESAVDETIARHGETGFFRSLVENTSDGFLTIDETSTIVFANPAIEQILGYQPQALVGESLLTLLPVRFRERHQESITRYLETGERSLDWNYIELPGRHADGHEVELAISFREHTDHEQHLFTGIIRDLTDRKARERDLKRYATIVDTVGDAVYQLDTTGTIVAINDVGVEVSGYSRDELAGAPVSLVLNDRDIVRSVEVIQDLLTNDDRDVGVLDLDIHTADGRVIPCEDRIALLRDGDDLQGTVGVLRDISTRKQRERAVARQRDELAELNRLNAVIRDINRTLVEAASREEIETAVCERLIEVDPYVFAWIGEHHPGRQEITPRVWAGKGGRDMDLDGVTVPTDDREPSRGPTAKAFKTGALQVVEIHRDRDDGAFEALRELGIVDDSRTVLAIPLRYRDSTYGVLALYSDRSGEIDEREQAVLAELGETIGHAINAVESKKLLHSDTVVELEFRIRDPNSSFITASAELGCTLTLEAVVPASESTFLYYITVTGAAPDAVLVLTDETPHLNDVTVISTHEEESLLLVRVSGSSAVMTLIEAGAHIKTAVADHGEALLIAELASDADTKTVVDTVQRVFPDSELLARRAVDRPVQTRRAFRDSVTDRLTDKQRAAIEAAYQGGYFARPRDISGSDLAASLGVTSSTFHHHLQTGLDKLVGAVFEPFDTE